MKTTIPQNSLRRAIALSVLTVSLFGHSAFAAALFYERFPTNYTEGGNLGAVGVGSGTWTSYTNGNSANILVTTNVTVASASALSYPGLVTASGSRGARVKAPSVGLQTDVVGFFTPQNAAGSSVYASVLMNIAVLPETNRPIANLSVQPSGSIPNTASKGGLFLDATGRLYVNIGVATAPTNTANSVSNTVALATNTTHLVVMRYNFISGSTNDTMDLWLDPNTNSFGVNASIPAATIQTATNPGANADNSSVGGFYIHLSSATTNGDWSMDEVRVGTNWADVTPNVNIPDASKCTLVASPSTLVPADGTNASTITITALNSGGGPISGVAASNIVVSASGAGVTVVQPTAATDSNGRTTATITAVNSGTKTISATINGLAITNQATVQFISANAQQLVWNGNLSADWDAATANWQGSLVYVSGDFVTFNDSGTFSTVNLTTALTPGGVTVSNSSRNYVFVGPGSLGGSYALTKAGSGTLTISNDVVNTFSGGITVAGGTLAIGADEILPTALTVTFSNTAGAVLNLNNHNQTLGRLAGGGSSGGNITLGSGTLTLTNNSGQYDGVISGNGSLVKAISGTQTLGGANTYSGGTTISGGLIAAVNPVGSATGTGFIDIQPAGSLRIGNGAYGGSVAAAVITNNGILRFIATNNVTFTNVVVGAGVLQQNGTNSTVTISAANFYTGTNLINFGVVRISNAAALGDSVSSTVNINNDLSARLELVGDITLANPLVIPNKNGAGSVFSPAVLNVSGTNAVTGAMQFVSGGSFWSFGADAGQLTVSGTIVNASTANTSGFRTLWLGGAANGIWNSDLVDNAGVCNAALLKDGAGTWTLTGTQDYSGNTTVSGGKLLLTGTINGGTGTTNIVLVTSGGAFGGTGSVARPVIVATNGTLAPGTAAIGTLTISSDLTFNGGGGLFKVNRSLNPSNDIVSVSGVLTNAGAGTITVTNIAGTALALGNSFKLFNKAVLNGGALTIAGVLPSGLTWANNLAVDGTVTVATLTPPTLSVSQNNNVISYSWTASGFHLQAQTNALNIGLSNNWSDYPNGATSPVNVSINSNNPSVFFRLKSP